MKGLIKKFVFIFLFLLGFYSSLVFSASFPTNCPLYQQQIVSDTCKGLYYQGDYTGAFSCENSSYKIVFKNAGFVGSSIYVNGYDYNCMSPSCPEDTFLEPNIPPPHACTPKPKIDCGGGVSVTPPLACPMTCTSPKVLNPAGDACIDDPTYKKYFRNSSQANDACLSDSVNSTYFSLAYGSTTLQCAEYNVDGKKTVKLRLINLDGTGSDTVLNEYDICSFPNQISDSASSGHVNSCNASVSNTKTSCPNGERLFNGDCYSVVDVPTDVGGTPTSTDTSTVSAPSFTCPNGEVIRIPMVCLPEVPEKPANPSAPLPPEVVPATSPNAGQQCGYVNGNRVCFVASTSSNTGTTGDSGGTSTNTDTGGTGGGTSTGTTGGTSGGTSSGDGSGSVSTGGTGGGTSSGSTGSGSTGGTSGGTGTTDTGGISTGGTGSGTTGTGSGTGTSGTGSGSSSSGTGTGSSNTGIGSGLDSAGIIDAINSLKGNGSLNRVSKGSDGSFDSSADLALSEAESALNSKIADIKNSIHSFLPSLSSSGGGLPVFSLGSWTAGNSTAELKIDLNDYSDSLSVVGSVFIFLASFMAFRIVLGGG